MGAATAAYMLGPGAMHSGPVYNALGVSAAVAVLTGIAINRPRPRLPWLLFAGGQALFVCGDVIGYNWTRFFGGDLPYPSLADALYLLVYPCLVGGLLILVHARSPARDRASLLRLAHRRDGRRRALVGVPHIAQRARRDAPAGDEAHVDRVSRRRPHAAGRARATRGRRGPSRQRVHLLVCGAFALLVTDSLGWRLLHGGYAPGGVLDPGWIAFYALWGAAALHPSMGSLADPAPEPDRGLTRRRLALLAGATLVAPTVLIVRLVQAHWTDAAMISASSLVLFALVVARMAGLVHDNEQTMRREKALREAGAALVAASGSCSGSIAPPWRRPKWRSHGDALGLGLLLSSDDESPGRAHPSSRPPSAGAAAPSRVAAPQGPRALASAQLADDAPASACSCAQSCALEPVSAAGCLPSREPCGALARADSV